MFENRILPVLLLMVALIVPTALSGQVPVDVSNQKIVSEGKTYYMHLVLKDQTLYSISKAYKVSIDAITSENVIPPNGIQTDQILKIPESASMAREKVQAAAPVKPKAQPEARPEEQPKTQPAVQPRAETPVPAEPAPKAESENYRMHKVKKGETLYSISRDYSVTVAALIRINDVPRNEINEGQMLRVPPSDFETFVKEEPEVVAKPDMEAKSDVVAEPEVMKPAEAQPEAVSEPRVEDKAKKENESKAQTQAAKSVDEKQPVKAESKEYHKVQKGESLSDIAKSHNISVRELKDANEGLLFPMPGMKLVIPVKGGTETREEK